MAVLLAGSFVGWRYLSQSGSLSEPSLEVIGLPLNGGISRDTSITIKAYDSSRVENLRIVLDGKALIDEKSIGKRSVSHSLELLVKELGNGAHTLGMEMTSSAEGHSSTRVQVPFHVDTMPLQATLTKNESEGRVYQGRTLHVEFQTNKEVKDATLNTLSSSYPCYLQSNRGFTYECFVPIECEEVAQEYPYSIDIVDWAGNTMQLDGKFTVVAFPFKKQALRVDKQKIQEENKIGRPEKELEDEVTTVTQKSPKKKLWHGQFIVPLELKDQNQITSDFGVIRATQERGLSQHKALDLIALPKSVVWAPQDGVIVIKDRYAHSGNTIAIDHGYGLISLFFHLDEFAEGKVGDSIKKGKPLGTVGKTGYATGYHLHWELRVNGVPVDPLEWTKQNF